ncbi:MAG: hypothetical protein IT317_17750 [Anaerolineales bacterium]|nr:hypothetical protein [Anaerolineales bacterium]
MPRKFVVVAVIELLVGVALVFYASALTLPGRRLVGRVADFPPSAEPYAVMDAGRVAFYLVNLAGELLALEPDQPTRPAQCWARWDEVHQVYSDPCYGARYTLDGAWCDGPAVRDLDRYAVEVNNGRVWVYTDYVIAGTPREVTSKANGSSSPGCPIPP